MFDEIPKRDVLSWSAIIRSHSKSGNPIAAMEAFRGMRRLNIEPNFVTILGLLSGIKNLIHLRTVHSYSMKSGLFLDLLVLNSMINIYLKCEEPGSARRLFDEMPRRDLVSWNTMISGYSHLELLKECFNLFRKMRFSSGFEPNHQTYSSLISCCASAHHRRRHYHLGKSIHGKIIVSGIIVDDRLETSLLMMYLKQKNPTYGIRLCDLSCEKDSIFWTSMISGLVQNERADDALKLFPRTLGILNSPTIASLLSACAQLLSFKLGASIHGYVLRSNINLDLPAQNSLLSMYAKCGHLHLSRLLFSSMEDKDLASWNSMISSFVHDGDLGMAMETTTRMMLNGLHPDDITVIILLKGSASLGSLSHGRILHGFIMRSNHDLHLLLSASTALVDMYCKCGKVELARRCFDSIMVEERDLVLWSSMISGYGIHGKGEQALELFSLFLATRIPPNKIIFLAVLTACSHAGLMHDALKIFVSMMEDMKETEHYACMVDLLSRKGMLREAAEVAVWRRSSPEVLGILLDACRMHGDMKFGEEVAREMMALEPGGAASYIQMARGFAAASRWDGVELSWRKMKEMGLKKTPGWSSVDVGGGAAATFFMGQTSHPRHMELNFLLMILYQEMRMNANDYDDDDGYDSNLLVQIY